MQYFGSFIVNLISGQKISDVTSGFRCYSKKSIERIQITSRFSYTLESLIQAKEKELIVSEIFIDVNEPRRKSRLFRSNYHFIKNQLFIILKCFSIYRPLYFFSCISLVPFFVGFILVLRFFINFLFFSKGGLIQSLTVGVSSLIIGFLIVILGILSELIKHNRKNINFFLYRKK